MHDAYFAPLHHYWLGTLLLAQCHGILLVTFASTFAIPQDINLFLFLHIWNVACILHDTQSSFNYKSSGIQSSYIL